MHTAAPDYSFCLFRIPATGARVIWEITNRCNYTCSYCIFSSNKRVLPGELDTDRALRLLDELVDAGFRDIKFTGGEPLGRADVFELLERAARHSVRFDISTNASYVTADRAKRLAELSLAYVHVSLDGHTREQHEAVRGPNTYLPTVRGIENLVLHGARVRIGCVIHAGNEGSLREICGHAALLGAQEIVFSRMEPVGRLRHETSSLSHQRDAFYVAQLDGVTSIKVSHGFGKAASSCAHGVCPGGERFLYIDAIGRVSPCTWVNELLPAYRSELTLKEASLSELLASVPIRRYRDDVVPAHTGCPIAHLKRAES